jgi:two-component system, OmpR family, response regulator ChvI
MLVYISKVIEMSKRILVIDDEPDVNITLRKVLEKNGFIVDSYENPFLALENFKPHYYDLLILDIKMPKMSGFSFYREIKKRDDKLKICFLTASELYNENLRRQTKEILDEVKRFISKPLTIEDLVIKVKKELAEDSQ